MFLDLRKGKALEKDKMEKIENGKTYLEDLELILTAAATWSIPKPPWFTKVPLGFVYIVINQL